MRKTKRQMTRDWMRREFGPDSEAKNEDGTPMTEAQLNKCADAWIDYFEAMNTALAANARARKKSAAAYASAPRC